VEIRVQGIARRFAARAADALDRAFSSARISSRAMRHSSADTTLGVMMMVLEVGAERSRKNTG
jgi:hypothetical protein